MAEITNAIAQRNYELVRTRIAYILGLELPNQATLTGETGLNATIFEERSIPIQVTSMPAVNVLLSTGEDNEPTTVQDGYTFTYYIDCYSTSKSTDATDGDKNAAIKLHRLMGVCAAILGNPVYRTLGFDAPSILHSKVRRFETQDPQNNQDANNVIVGRLWFEVRVVDGYVLKTPPAFAANLTKIEISDSLEGFELETLNAGTVDVKKSDGTLIASILVNPSETEDYLVADSLIQSTGVTPAFTDSVKATDTYTIADVTYTDSDTTVKTAEYGSDIVCTPNSGGALMTANFSTDKVEANIGEVITFTDLTDELPTHWSWRFGDGNTSIVQNPTHSYDSMGTYSVTLLAGRDGAGDIEIKTDLISVIAAFLNEYSYLFDGVDEYLNFGTVAPARFNQMDSFSISGWFKTTRDTNNDILMHWNGTSGYRLFNLSGDVSFIFYNTLSQRIFVRTNLSFNNGFWHHFVVTYDGSSNASGVKIYVDGVSQALTVVSDSLVGSTITYGDLLVSGNVNFFDGNIDETAIYNKVLSAAEVSEIYNAGAPNDLSTLSTSANLLFWHRADNDTWGGTNFTCIDEVNANNGVSVNMEETDRELDTP